MSETQSVTIKPRFELVLGAFLLVIVLAVALRTAHSEQAEPISTELAEEQAVPDEIRDRQVLAECEGRQDDPHLEGLQVSEGMTYQGMPGQIVDLQALEEYKYQLGVTASKVIPTTNTGFAGETATIPDSGILKQGSDCQQAVNCSQSNSWPLAAQ